VVNILTEHDFQDAFKNVTRAENGAYAQKRDYFEVVRFEVFTAVTMKNGVLWDVTPCGSCKNRSLKSHTA
jgi:hypothetical protein